MRVIEKAIPVILAAMKQIVAAVVKTTAIVTILRLVIQSECLSQADDDILILVVSVADAK